MSRSYSMLVRSRSLFSVMKMLALPSRMLSSAVSVSGSALMISATWPVTAAELRAAVAISRAYRSVVLEMLTQARGVEDTIAEQRGDVGRRLLNAYELAKRQNKQEPRLTLIPHLVAVQRALNRGRKKMDEASKAARAARAARKALPQTEVKP